MKTQEFLNNILNKKNDEDKLNIKLYNKGGFKLCSCMENILIKSYEACQVRKEAAISKHLRVPWECLVRANCLGTVRKDLLRDRCMTYIEKADAKNASAFFMPNDIKKGYYIVHLSSYRQTSSLYVHLCQTDVCHDLDILRRCSVIRGTVDKYSRIS